MEVFADDEQPLLVINASPRYPTLGQPVRITVTIELSAEALAALQVLDDHGDARSTLLELVGRVVDGVTRPAAWERAWLEQAFGDAWQERLEPDPSAPWRQRPRRLRGRCRRAQ